MANLVLAAAMCLTSSNCFAQTERVNVETEGAKDFRAFAKKEAAGYVLRLEGSERPLQLQAEPILSYTDPIVGGVYGDVFIWTADGRPEAVAAFYRFSTRDPHRGAGFHSLSLGKLTAMRDGAVAWSPMKPGLKLEAIPGAPVPADSAAERLRQMNALRREFSGRQTTRAGVENAMSLLPKPLYRYRGTKGDLIDGALFVLVHGGAPEIFLLIEAQRRSDGISEWRFGAVRMHGIDLRMSHRGQLVWEAPQIPWAQIIDHRQAFWGFRVEMAGDP